MHYNDFALTNKRFTGIDWENPGLRFFTVFVICVGTYLFWDYRVPQIIELVGYPDEHDYSFNGELAHYAVGKWVFYCIYVVGLILTALDESWKRVFVLIAFAPLFFGIFYWLYGHIPI